MHNQHLFEFDICGRAYGFFGAVGAIETLDASAELPERTAIDLFGRIAYCSAGSVEFGELDRDVDLILGFLVVFFFTESWSSGTPTNPASRTV